MPQNTTANQGFVILANCRKRALKNTLVPTSCKPCGLEYYVFRIKLMYFGLDYIISMGKVLEIMYRDLRLPDTKLFG